jgi:hypothetical protein
MDRSKESREVGRVFNNDWIESLQSIVVRTENNLKGISAKDDPLHDPRPHTHTVPC